MKHAITASYYCLLLACLCLSNPSPAYSDPESQLTSIRYSTVPSYVTSLTGSNFAYDNYGRETSESDDWESTGTSYDDNDDVLGVTKSYVSASTGATMTQGTWSHQYDPDGSLKDQELYIGTGAYPIYYYYDNLGRMTAVTDATSSAGQETDYSYYSNGWLQSRTEWPEGRNSGPQAADTATYTYNPRGFMIDLKTVYPPSAIQNEFGATSGTSEMQYDAAGNLLSMPVNDVSYSSLSGTTSYTYNSQNEVTQETSTRNGGYTYNYNYDAAGNATEMRNATQYFNADNQLTGSYGYTYDGDGNPTAYANTTAAYALSYDTEDRLTAAYVSGAPQMYARYDADGLRAWQEESSIFTYDIYDGDDLFALATASSSNVMSTNYYQVFGPNGLISQTGSGWAQFFANDPLDNATQVDGYYYGNLGYPYISDAYGLVAGTGTSTGGFTIGAGFTVPLGTLYDNGLGYGSSGSPNLPLTLMGHREYDANTGRFLTRDPIGYAGGINQYAYADDNPVGGVDPDGTTITAPTGARDLAYYTESIKYLNNSSTFRKIYDELESSKTDYKIVAVHDDPYKDNGEHFDPNNDTIYWWPLWKEIDEDDSGNPNGECQTPALGLAHELGHAYDLDTNPAAFINRVIDRSVGKIWTDAEEKWNILNNEDTIAAELNAAHAAPGITEGIRTNHLGRPFEVSGPVRLDFGGN